jgi:periplasmic divalent cation tolerance protein
MIIIISTFSQLKEAKQIINHLLTKKLIACANLFPVQSYYWWQGKKQREKEYLVFLKTRASLFSQVKKEILAKHSYSLPEIVALKVEKFSSDYRQWLFRQTIKK